jgi:hypothetical protein
MLCKIVFFTVIHSNKYAIHILIWVSDMKVYLIS